MLTYSTVHGRKTGGHPFKRGKEASVNLLLKNSPMRMYQKPVCEGGYGALNCKISKVKSKVKKTELRRQSHV